MHEGVDCCGPAKTSHKGFCLVTFVKLTKYWPSGSYLVMESTQKVPGAITLMEIVYKYNSRKVLGLVVTKSCHT